MSGISSGTGLISGINTGALIDQLIAIDARPKTLIQQRIAQLQAQQAAYLSINSNLGALRTAAQAFRINNIFGSAQTSSSDATILTATAAAGAATGSYSFIVDRLVSTQQQLSRGFASRSTGVGASSLTFEPAAGRLDRDVQLSELNGGDGIVRGHIRITDSTNASADVDLSRVATVGDVVNAINSATGIHVTASVDGDHLVIHDGANGSVTVADSGSTTTATSLGIAGTAAGGTITGSSVYRLRGTSSLQSLNDGNGIRISNAAGTDTHDFRIVDRTGASHSIDIGDIYTTVAGVLTKTSTAVSSIQGVIDRINAQTGGAVTASISADGSGLTITDNTTGTGNLQVADDYGAAADLGIVGDVAGPTITGSRIISGLNSTLASNLLGGAGLSSGSIDITARDGSVFNLTLPTGGSVSDIIKQIATGSGGKITAALDQTGTGLTLTDTTGGTGNLIIGGAAATALGLATAPAGVASSTVNSARLQHRYLAESTLLSSLNGGRGIGTGSFQITDSAGTTQTVTIGDSATTVGDVIANINSRGLAVRARINDRGDGIIIEENPPSTSTIKIRAQDTGGTVAASLHLAGEAAGPGADNHIDGSAERTVTLLAGDTLDDIARKVNDANVGANVSVISDGTPNSPYHLSITARSSGEEGRFTLDTGGFDFGLRTLSDGQNARVFFGSSDPATGVLLTSTTNSFSGIISGVTVDLHGVSTQPTTLSITRDTGAIEDAVNAFISAYNTAAGRIDTLSSYNPDTQQRGTLLGDSTGQSLRAALSSSILRRATGVSGPFQYLSQVGIKLGSDGSLSLDSAKFEQALQQDSQGVANLLSARVQDPPHPVELPPGVTSPGSNTPDTFSSLGVLENVGRLVDSYLDPINGILTQRNTTLGDQIDQQNKNIAEIDTRLEAKRTFLQNQFNAMEQALATLQNQQAAIGQIQPLA